MHNQLPKAPEWLTESLTSRHSRTANLDAAPGELLSIGSRNSTLTRMGGFLRRLGSDQSQIAAALTAINAGSPNPLPDDEVEGIARSLCRYTAAEHLELDDLPLSRYISEQLANSCCFTLGGGWYHFDGVRWVQNKAAVVDEVKKVLERLFDAIRAAGDVDQIKNAAQLRSGNKLKRLMDLIENDPRISRRLSDFDGAAGKLNLLNGTMDLTSGALHEHRSADLQTKVARAEYDPEATCPNFDKLLDDTLPEGHQRFLLRVFGYSLIGDPKEHVFAMLHGPGANGKSTVVGAVAHALGDYATNAEPSTFIKQKNHGVRDDLARLRGALMVSTSELATGEILDAALVKRLTGGDPITARALYKEHFEYRPQFVLFMTTNALPVIDGGDGALARRILVLPFTRVIAAENQDKNLPAKLRAEAAGIFNRLLQGLRDYQSDGLAIPDDIKREVNRYTGSSDMISMFLEDECIAADGQSTAASALYMEYRTWTGLAGLKPLSMPQFKQEITKRTSISQRKTRGGMVWPGIGLRRFANL